MPKLRKMLGKADSPYILSLMNLIDTQSHVTIVRWCVGYKAENVFLPIYKRSFPDDTIMVNAISVAKDQADGNANVKDIKSQFALINTTAKEIETHQPLRLQRLSLRRLP